MEYIHLKDFISHQGKTPWDKIFILWLINVAENDELGIFKSHMQKTRVSCIYPFWEGRSGNFLSFYMAGSVLCFSFKLIEYSTESSDACVM